MPMLMLMLILILIPMPKLILILILILMLMLILMLVLVLVLPVLLVLCASSTTSTSTSDQNKKISPWYQTYKLSLDNIKLKVDHHTGDKRFIRGPKQCKENQSLCLLIMLDLVYTFDIKVIHGIFFNPYFEKKVRREKHIRETNKCRDWILITPDKRQEIIGTIVGLSYWCIYASLGLNDQNLFMFLSIKLSTDRQTYRWTDWLTDGRVDRQFVSSYAPNSFHELTWYQ